MAGERSQKPWDRLADCKNIYDKHGGDRNNLVYGYIRKRDA